MFCPRPPSWWSQMMSQARWPQLFSPQISAGSLTLAASVITGVGSSLAEDFLIKPLPRWVAWRKWRGRRWFFMPAETSAACLACKSHKEISLGELRFPFLLSLPSTLCTSQPAQHNPSLPTLTWKSLSILVWSLLVQSVGWKPSFSIPLAALTGSLPDQQPSVSLKGSTDTRNPLSQKSHLLWQPHSLFPINPSPTPSKEDLLILAGWRGRFVVQEIFPQEQERDHQAFPSDHPDGNNFGMGWAGCWTWCCWIEGLKLSGGKDARRLWGIV